MRFHNKLKSVDHWIASDGAGFMLVEGIFVPGTKKRSFWFTVGSLFQKEPAKTVYYLMKNGLIYEDKYWWKVVDYAAAIITNPDMDMLEGESTVPVTIDSLQFETRIYVA